MHRRALVIALAALVAPRLAPSQPIPLRDVRETVAVSLPGNVTELWQLVWTEPPRRYCNDPAETLTCPCAGFPFADQGPVDLVRSRNGQVVERFPLGPLFASGGSPTGPGAPTFARWSLTDEDHQVLTSTDDEAVIRARFERRPAAPVLVLGDFNGDGVRAEFVLQVGAGPCGHRPSVLVGLGANGRLHAFGRAGRRPSPLILQSPEQWEELRGGRSARLVQWSCGDHGSDEESWYMVRWSRGEPVFRASARACPSE